MARPTWTVATPLAEEVDNLAFCMFTAAEYLQRVGRELTRLSDAELAPLEREWRLRQRRHDPRAHENLLRAARKRRTAGSGKPAA